MVDLRKQAYKMNLSSLKKSEIKFANKEALIQAIMAEIERSEDEVELVIKTYVPSRNKKFNQKSQRGTASISNIFAKQIDAIVQAVSEATFNQREKVSENGQ